MEGIIKNLTTIQTSNPEYPIILAGDFNSGSHLDWVSEVKDLNAGYIMPFPTRIYLEGLGFKDSFREVHKDPKKERGITWTPINPKTHQDRIDFIFYKGEKLRVMDSKVINKHPIRFPSDHAAVVSVFKFIKP